MSLNSLQDSMSRRAASMAAMAKRSSNPQDIQAIQQSLVEGVQSGAIQPYVGIPLIQELTQRLTEAKAQMAQGMAGMQQPQQDAPIAQQVMQQAAQEGQGLEALPSNLPQEYAGGGIIAFADRGLVDSKAGEQEARDYQADLLKRQQAALALAEAPDAAAIKPNSMQDFVRQYQNLMTAIPKGTSQTEYEEYLKNRSGGAEATKQQDLNLALAQFGLNLAAGKSPNALENIGEAGIKSLPAVQEAYKQRRLADETALRGRAELDRMTRAEQIEALKGGMGLYGEERKLSADEKKAELQRKNALAVAELQMQNKPTDLMNHVNDYIAAQRVKGDPRPIEVIKLEGYTTYPGYDVRRQIAGIQAGVAGAAQNVTSEGQVLDAKTAALNAWSKLMDSRNETSKTHKRLEKQDAANALAGKPTTLADDYRKKWFATYTPGAVPAPAAPPPPPPPPKGAAPSIANVKGAPAGSKIGAYTQKGWEVRDQNGTLLGYTQGSK